MNQSMTLQSDTTGLRSFRPELTRPFRPAPRQPPLGPIGIMFDKPFILFFYFSCLCLFSVLFMPYVCNSFQLSLCLSVLTSVFPILDDNVSTALFLNYLSVLISVFLAMFITLCLSLFSICLFLFVWHAICVVAYVWILGDQSPDTRVVTLIHWSLILSI